MNRLFIVRHGLDNATGLDEAGFPAIDVLAQRIKALKGNGETYIGSSKLKRAMQTAERIAAVLGAPVEGRVDLLPSGDLELKKGLELEALLREKEHFGTVVLVTHDPVVKGFPVYFGAKLGIEVSPIRRAPHATGAYFDLEKKTYRYLE